MHKKQNNKQKAKVIIEKMFSKSVNVKYKINISNQTFL